MTSVSDPALLFDALDVQLAEAVMPDGLTRPAMLLTFMGRFLVDGQELPSAKTQIAVPAEMFVPVLMHMGQVASNHGLAPPVPYEQCRIVHIISPTGRAESIFGAYVVRCVRPIAHRGQRHISHEGETWTSDEAEAAWDAFDGVDS